MNLLRYVYPICYSRLIEKLMEENIHSHDIEATVHREEEQVTIILRYGEQWTQVKQQTFDIQIMKTPTAEMDRFFEETAKACKQALIQDYFKMMKP